jgi:drug/metabolite transporter (DMT)-like permease
MYITNKVMVWLWPGRPSVSSAPGRPANAGVPGRLLCYHPTMSVGTNALLVGLSVAASTLMWPVNRWVLSAPRPSGDRKTAGGVPEVYGFWIGTSGAAVAAVLSLLTGQRLDIGVVWILGAVVGLAFAVGYCIALMRCLATGPLGPSAVVNNMGLLWPVVLGAVWIQPHRLGVLSWLGLGLVVAGLVAFGFSRPTPREGVTAPARGASLRWGMWALLTWVAAGVSMSTQLAASVRAPEAPLPMACAYLASAAVFLLPIVLVGRRRLASPREMAAGAANGTLQVIAVSSMLVALRTLGAEVVYPFAVGLPVVLTLLLGTVVYRERVDRAGWIASALGVVGLVALSAAG